ncbi:MAG: SufS family cysteine desulfurase [Candidatus Diapherotrites archaeon]
MNTEKIRADFPVLQRRVNGKPITYLDNAATSLKPRQVLDAMNRYYTEFTANIHRGVHRMSEDASREWEDAHKRVGKFVGASPEQTIFTRNTTESLNLLMYSLREQGIFGAGSNIVVTKMEHHSNIVPWQFLERKGEAKLEFAGLNVDYTLDMEDLKKKINKNTRLVSVMHASNTVASINPVREIGKIAHENGALFVVDGAQAVPHMPVDVKKIGADFYAFSGHKMLGPTGIGVLCGRKELLEKMPPFLYGGDMIHEVKLHSATWNVLPYKFEAGTPHIAGGIGLGAAVDYLQRIGMDNVHAHGKDLTRHALKVMGELEGRGKIRLYCPKDAEKQGAITMFDALKLQPHELALALDEAENIAIRSGMHCAEPLVSGFNSEGLCRASFYLYNTKEEIDLLARTTEKILGAFG